MTITSIFMQIVQQVQFIGMLSQLDIDWPDEWFSFTSVFQMTNLSFENIIGDRKIPTFNNRMIFILVSICLPLCINLLLLIIFQPAYVVLWYVCLCFGFVLLAAGLAARFLPSAGVESNDSDANNFIVFGAAFAGGALLILIIVKIVQKCLNDKDDAANFQENERYYRRFHRKRALKHVAIFVFLAIIAVLCLRIVEVTVPNTNSRSMFDDPIIFICGIVFAVLAVFVGLYMVVNWCRCGRRCMQKVENFGKRNILLVLLTLVSISYIPVISYAVSNFLCREYECPIGTVFNPYAHRPPESFDTGAGRYCDACTFNTTTAPTCGRNVSAAHSWCPGFKESRSWKHPDISCEDEAVGYFYAASLIVLVIYMFGIPLLFFRVIQYLTGNVSSVARIGPGPADEDENDRWIRQMAAIEPVAASLYDPFRFKRRYYTLAQLVHRLLITFVITVAAAYSRAAVVFLLVFHGGVCCLLVLTKPYVTAGEQLLAMTLAICNVLNSIYAIIVWQTDDGSVPSYTSYIFVVLNGVIPAVGVVVGSIVARKYRKKKAEEAEKQLAIERAQAYDAAEDEAQMAAVAPGATPTKQNDGAEPYPADEDGADNEEKRVRPVPGAIMVDDEHEFAAEDGDPAAQPYDGDDATSSESYDSDAMANLSEEAKARMKRAEEYRKRKNTIQENVFNEHSTNTMNKAFMVMGIFFLLALGIAFLGLLRQSTNDYLVSSESGQMDRENVFAGYASWDDFTSHCCCIPQQTPSPDFRVAERWVCENGKIVERGRMHNSGENGLPIRDLCATSFNEACSVTSPASDEDVELNCPPESSIFTTTSENARAWYF